MVSNNAYFILKSSNSVTIICSYSFFNFSKFQYCIMLDSISSLNSKEKIKNFGILISATIIELHLENNGFF